MEAGDDAVAWRWVSRLAVVAGIGASVLFVAVGLATRLQMFGDGSIFSYAIAAQDAWAFHWHNISGRLFVYLYAYVPAEALVALTNSANAGIATYGLLFFAAPLLGLLLTLFADCSKGRVLFTYACLSTAALCPLVYGAPTEMWMAHALFWPTLALCLYAPQDARGRTAVFASLLALILTHEGAIIFAATILLAVFLRGWRHVLFARAVAAFAFAMAIWLIVKLAIRPDDYIAGVMNAAAFKFIDIGNLTEPVFVLLVVAIAVDDVMTIAFRRMAPRMAHIISLIVCVILLATYWFWFDRSLLAEDRYNLRTVLLILTPAFGLMATIQAMDETARTQSPLPFLSTLAAAIERACNPRIVFSALVLTLLVHAVETTKLVWGWTHYKAAVMTLATGSASDPTLGDPHFVSAARIDPALNRLSWHSTTPYLSVLLAPSMTPDRLVIDPRTGYFWLACDTAKQSERDSAALPPDSRQLIRAYSCQHR
jgi:hypothetical protein